MFQLIAPRNEAEFLHSVLSFLHMVHNIQEMVALDLVFQHVYSVRLERFRVKILARSDVDRSRAKFRFLEVEEKDSSLDFLLDKVSMEIGGVWGKVEAGCYKSEAVLTDIHILGTKVDSANLPEMKWTQ